MASNLSDLAKLATASNAAKYQGSGTGGWGTALRYLGAVAAPLAGMQQSGIVPAFLSALGNVGQVKNESAYNQYLKKVAEFEQANQLMENQNNAQLYTDATGKTVANPNAGFNTTFAGGLVPDIRKGAGNSAIAALARGEMPTFDDDNADYGSLPTEVFKQQAGVATSDAALGQAGGLFGQGQGQSGRGGTIPPNQLREPAGLDNGTLAAGASAQNVIAPTVSPFLQAAFNPSDVFGQFQAGATDTQNTRKQTEVERSNKADEGLKKGLYASQQAENYASAKLKNRTDPNIRSGGGGSQNPYTIPNAMLENLNKQAGIAQKGLKALGLWDDKKGAPKDIGAAPKEYGEWDFNPFDGTIMPTTSGRDAKYREKLNSYNVKKRAIERYQRLVGETPFGNQAVSNLDNSASSLSQNIYPGKARK